MYKLINIFMTLILLMLSFEIIAIPKAEKIPGGIVIIPLNIQSKQAPKVYYQHKRVMVIANKNAKTKPWLAIIGIPLGSKIGTHHIKINDQHYQKFKIGPKKYPAQYIKIKNKRLVTPNKVDQKRIKHERQQLRRLYQHWDSQRVPNTKFIWPVKGPISSVFGLHRYFNQKPHGYHQGIDIAAPSGTPIRAPAAGKILAANNYFYTGNTVVINHGQNLVTVYAHLSKFGVKTGQKVKQGQIIGNIGQTGRATGPHLHWGVMLNSARVNPKLFLDKTSINSNAVVQ